MVAQCPTVQPRSIKPVGKYWLRMAMGSYPRGSTGSAQPAGACRLGWRQAASPRGCTPEQQPSARHRISAYAANLAQDREFLAIRWFQRKLISLIGGPHWRSVTHEIVHPRCWWGGAQKVALWLLDSFLVSYVWQNSVRKYITHKQYSHRFFIHQ